MAEWWAVSPRHSHFSSRPCSQNPSAPWLPVTLRSRSVSLWLRRPAPSPWQKQPGNCARRGGSRMRSRGSHTGGLRVARVGGELGRATQWLAWGMGHVFAMRAQTTGSQNKSPFYTERSLRNEGGGLVFKCETQLMVPLMEKKIPRQMQIDVITGKTSEITVVWWSARFQITTVKRVIQFFGVPVHIKIRFTLSCSL